MVRNTQNYEGNNGSIMRFFSNRLNKGFIVVEFYDSPYMNIFDCSKEKEALLSLAENDMSCQSRAASIPNFFLDNEEEFMFGVFCACFEATDGDIEKAVTAMDDNFDIENGCTYKFWD